MTESAPASVVSAVPIIVGVTGHRDILSADFEKLAGQVEEVFKELRARYPATPLQMLSPLAEGADRIVAEVAFKNNIELIVPLPMPRAEYEKQFNSAESREQFDLLLGKARKFFEVPLAPGLKDSKALDVNQQYAQVGAYIAYHSHILIALWDGESTGLEGGTSQIVDFKLKGIPMPYAYPRKYLDIVDNGPVYHIVTPREENPTPKKTAFTQEIKFPEGWIPVKPGESQKVLEASYERILSRMNTFNSDVNRLGRKLSDHLKRNRAEVIPDAEHSTLSEADRFILDRYAMADALAQHFQRLRHRTLILLFVIFVLAVFSFEVYAHLFASPLILILYPFWLGVAVLLYVWTKLRDFQNKYLDYRALAEGLRVQLFWNLAGISEEVAEHYLRQHRTELEWIRNAIRAWNVLASNVYGSEQRSATRSCDANAELVLERWIDRQLGFFDERTEYNRKKSDGGQRKVRVFFVLGLLVSAAVFILHYVRSGFDETSHLRHWLIILMGITPAIAAAIGGYVERMAFSAQAKRYDWMTALFERAGKRLRILLQQPLEVHATVAKSSDNKYTPAQQLILDLGCEALEENGDWVMIHREKTTDVYRGA